jgi:hypothetical protein
MAAFEQLDSTDKCVDISSSLMPAHYMCILMHSLKLILLTNMPLTTTVDKNTLRSTKLIH